VAGAVQALHDHGILHRDLKPSNIMLASRSGNVRAIVTDFGLAKTADPGAGGLFESQVGFQMGAPYFMAPELLRGARPSVASDIYALGLILDEMVTESRAFPAESIQALYYQKLWELPVLPTARSRQLDPHWDAVILRCLSQDPNDRYQHASDVVRDLAAAALLPPINSALNQPAICPEPLQHPLARRLVIPAIPPRFKVAISVLSIILLAIWAVAASLLHARPISLVVFPIENLTDRPEYNYLCKGTTAEVMRRLTVTGRVQVIPYYVQRSKAPPGPLRGRYSLDGILQIVGSQVRLTAQLIDNQDGSLIWSQNIEQSLRNSLQLQSDMAEGAIRALETRTLFGPGKESRAGVSLPQSIVRLLGFQKAILPPSATPNSVAFDYYIRGRDLLEERTVPAALSALQCFQNALREDPTFALAMAGLADLQPILMDYEYEPTAVLAVRAQDYAAQAIRLNPNIADVYTSLGAARQNTWDFAGAEDAYKTAIRVNPLFSKGHRWYAGLVLQYGRLDEGISEARTAIELDPYDFPGLSTFGYYLYLARRYPEAVKTVEDALTHKESIYARNYLGDIYFQMAQESSGQEALTYYSHAIEQADQVEVAVRRAMSQAPPPSAPVTIKFADRMHAEYYTLNGHPELAEPSIARLKADVAAGRTSPVPLAMYYAAVGDAANAMPLLERAADRKDRQLLYLKVSPQYDKIRMNPRFQALLSSMKLL
jgi:TolB-like protein/tetratricopeptide (TPR) repeat protein